MAHRHPLSRGRIRTDVSRRSLESGSAARFARLAIDCVGREYPNHPLTVLLGHGDVRSPRTHTPAFFGCFDWHSAVHGHWTLVRLARLFPGESWAAEAREALRRSLTPENLAAEVRHLSKPGRVGFERPYGLAWLLQLGAELRGWGDADAAEMAGAISALERLCRDRLAEWLPKLSHPIRSGEHSQTAFAMGLAFDWAVAVGEESFRELLAERAIAFYGSDTDLPIRFEPSGHDFLSPAFAEADLMRRVLPNDAFREWLQLGIPQIRWLQLGLPEMTYEPVTPADRADCKLAQLDGINLRRAWMLE